MSKSTKVILAIVVVVALILIFDPFGGSDIEGEWELVSGEIDGETADASSANVRLIFGDDGTVTLMGMGSASGSYDYSYDGNTLVIDGDECDCTIKGDTMTVEASTRSGDLTLTFHRK